MLQYNDLSRVTAALQLPDITHGKDARITRNVRFRPVRPAKDVTAVIVVAQSSHAPITMT